MGFYIKNEDQFNKWKTKLELFKKHKDFSIVDVCDEKPKIREDLEVEGFDIMEDGGGDADDFVLV